MKIAHLENALSHVTSQLLGRSLPVPHPVQAGVFDACSLYQQSAGYLTDLILEHLHGHAKMPAWAQAVYHKLSGRFIDVVKTLYEHVDCVQQYGGLYLLFSDERYPEKLRHIPHPPVALTLLGSSALLERPKIAIIGSRKASAYALFETEKLATWISDRRIVIVSGCAYGCDQAAHQGAINSGLCPIPSITVIPGGFERLGPAVTSALQRTLLEGGAVFVSERLWWSQAQARDFVMRNRIISGLCHELLIMQAEERSGSMSTARHALDQGCQIYVLRHPSQDARACGSKKLIEEGAVAIDGAEDFFLKVLLDKHSSVN
jgi:DNA processing protein